MATLVNKYKKNIYITKNTLVYRRFLLEEKKKVKIDL